MVNEIKRNRVIGNVVGFLDGLPQFHALDEPQQRIMHYEGIDVLTVNFSTKNIIVDLDYSYRLLDDNNIIADDDMIIDGIIKYFNLPDYNMELIKFNSVLKIIKYNSIL